MKKNVFSKSVWGITLSTLLVSGGLASCSSDKSEPYVLQQTDITVNVPESGFKAVVDQLFKIEVNSVSDEGVTYAWTLDGETLSNSKRLEYIFPNAGEYELKLTATQGTNSFSYTFQITVGFGDGSITTPEGAKSYITKVFDFMPAVGQFTNVLPSYEEGDTQEKMNQKVLDAIGNGNRSMISLGGFGGYVTVGFDHTIENKPGLRDFRVLGNAFYSAANPNPDAPVGGSCEPGVIMVAYDKNKNGMPDDDEWYEIAGSAHNDPEGEAWYQMAVNAGNDVHTYKNYQIYALYV